MAQNQPNRPQQSPTLPASSPAPSKPAPPPGRLIKEEKDIPSRKHGRQ